MFTKEDPLSLEGMGDGAVIEQFNEVLQKVLDNIVDPNTEAEQVRKVTLRMSIKPDAEREIGEIRIECAAQYAAAKKVVVKCLIGRIGKRGEARELKSAQQSFLPTADNVTSIDERREDND